MAAFTCQRLAAWRTNSVRSVSEGIKNLGKQPITGTWGCRHPVVFPARVLSLLRLVDALQGELWHAECAGQSVCRPYPDGSGDLSATGAQRAGVSDRLLPGLLYGGNSSLTPP